MGGVVPLGLRGGTARSLLFRRKRRGVPSRDAGRVRDDEGGLRQDFRRYFRPERLGRGLGRDRNQGAHLHHLGPRAPGALSRGQLRRAAEVPRPARLGIDGPILIDRLATHCPRRRPYAARKDLRPYVRRTAVAKCSCRAAWICILPPVIGTRGARRRTGEWVSLALGQIGPWHTERVWNTRLPLYVPGGKR
jgi:hypothetical protein